MSIHQKINFPTTVEELKHNIQKTIQYYINHTPYLLKAEPGIITLDDYCASLEIIPEMITGMGGQLPDSSNCNTEFIQSAVAEEFFLMLCIVETSIIQALVDGSISHSEYENEGEKIIERIWLTFMFVTPDMYKPRTDAVVYQSLTNLDDFKYI